MIYENIEKAKFLNRRNRFIAEIEINGKVEICHVKNTGRCKELLIEGVTIYVQKSKNENRKTKYSLISVLKGDKIINIDSQIPNDVVYEAIVNKAIPCFENITFLKREVKYCNSRFDIYFENSNSEKGFIEVKGVTLEEDKIVRFPDAPSERAVKHINELIKAKENGYLAYIIFVIQMSDVKYFKPNYETHLEFANTLKIAKDMGVLVFAYDCFVDQFEIKIKSPVQVKI